MKRQLLSVLLLGALLSGCTYFTAPEEEAIVVEKPDFDSTVDITAGSDNVPRPKEIDQDELAWRTSGGRVEVFDTSIDVGGSNAGEGQRFFSAFDERGTALTQPQSQPRPLSASAPFNYDSSVQIIPLDDDMRQRLNNTSRAQAPSAPVIQDPEVQTQSLDWPSTSQNQDPAPLTERVVQSGEPPVTRTAPALFPGGVSGRAEEDVMYLRAAEDDFIKLYFDHDSDEISLELQRQIAELVKSYSKYENSIFSIEGHASRESSIPSVMERKIVNLDVSSDRALAVSRALIENGVPGDKIRIVAWGEGRPARDLEGKTPEEAARRVEIRPLNRQ